MQSELRLHQLVVGILVVLLVMFISIVLSLYPVVLACASVQIETQLPLLPFQP